MKVRSDKDLGHVIDLGKQRKHRWILWLIRYTGTVEKDKSSNLINFKGEYKCCSTSQRTHREKTSWEAVSHQKFYFVSEKSQIQLILKFGKPYLFGNFIIINFTEFVN